MPTPFWVDPVGGLDGNSGDDFVTAKQTIPAGLALLTSVNDVLNLTNTGVHTWPTSETSLTGLAGTSESNFGAKIQGTTSTGLPALVTIRAIGANGVRRFIGLQATANHIILENLLLDAVDKVSDANSYHVARSVVSNAAGPVYIRYGGVLGGPTGQVSAGERTTFESGSGTPPNDAFRIKYWYFQNCQSPLGSSPGYGGGTIKTQLTDCVGIWDAAGRTSAWFNGTTHGSAPTNDIKLLRNTFYEKLGATAIVNIYQQNYTASANAGTFDCHSNLNWVDTTLTVSPFIAGGVGATSVVHAGIIGPNVLIGGPSVSAGDLTSNGWYQLPWDANDNDAVAPDEWPTDTVVYGEADTAVFNNPNATFAWVLPNGLTITILKDLRPKKYQTAGLFGAAPGALPVITSGTDSGGGNPDDPATIPYLDVVPFYTNVFEYTANLRLSTRQNRVEKHYYRDDTEGKGFREYTSRIIALPPSTTVQLHSGIETAEFVILESDQPVQLSAGIVEDVFLPDTKVAVLRGGEYKIIKVKNASATVTATLLITAVD